MKSFFSQFVIWASNHGVLNFLEDKKYLKLLFQARLGKKLNLDAPNSLNEKMQWLKLYNRNPIYTQLVDKFEAKRFIAETIGEEYNIPTFGVWDSFDQIDFESLPNEFVLKCTHDSGGLIICKNKSSLDISESQKTINKALKNKYFYHNREWPYKSVKPRIIAEQLLRNDNGEDLLEYNFFCFNGEPRIALRCSGDKMKTRYNDYFEIDGQRLPFRWGYLTSDAELEINENYWKMIDLSKKLSANIPFSRMDFYVCNSRIYMGEITFFHWGGFMRFDPAEWDNKLGSMLTLPKKELR